MVKVQWANGEIIEGADWEGIYKGMEGLARKCELKPREFFMYCEHRGFIVVIQEDSMDLWRF